MPTVAEIAKKAFDGVAAKMPGVINDATLTKPGEGSTYDPATGQWQEVPPTIYDCRALIDTSTPLIDVFPAFVAGPGDTLIYLEGLTAEPAKNDKISIGGAERIIQGTGDIVGAGEFFVVVAR